jgi:polysaccharide pyruvyl transferase WcaK-like protein
MKQFLKPGREICESIQEVYEVYQHHLVHCIISMRLHSIILSYVYGLDQIVLSYSQKTDEVLKKLEK